MLAFPDPHRQSALGRDHLLEHDAHAGAPSSSEGAIPRARPQGVTAPSETSPQDSITAAKLPFERRELGRASPRPPGRPARAAGGDGIRSRPLATDPAGPGGAQPPPGKRNRAPGAPRALPPWPAAPPARAG